MMYYNNRLIKAYHRVGCQVTDRRGIGVIGVIECNHLEPTQNKQDFENTDTYRNTIRNVATKLGEYNRSTNPGDKEPIEETDDEMTENDDESEVASGNYFFAFQNNKNSFTSTSETSDNVSPDETDDEMPDEDDESEEVKPLEGEKASISEEQEKKEACDERPDEDDESEKVKPLEGEKASISEEQEKKEAWHTIQTVASNLRDYSGNSRTNPGDNEPIEETDDEMPDEDDESEKNSITSTSETSDNVSPDETDDERPDEDDESEEVKPLEGEKASISEEQEKKKPRDEKPDEDDESEEVKPLEGEKASISEEQEKKKPRDEMPDEDDESEENSITSTSETSDNVSPDETDDERPDEDDESEEVKPLEGEKASISEEQEKKEACDERPDEDDESEKNSITSTSQTSDNVSPDETDDERPDEDDESEEVKPLEGEKASISEEQEKKKPRDEKPDEDDESEEVKPLEGEKANISEEQEKKKPREEGPDEEYNSEKYGNWRYFDDDDWITFLSTLQTSGEGASGTKRPRPNCDEGESEMHFNPTNSAAPRLTEEKQDLPAQIHELNLKVKPLEGEKAKISEEQEKKEEWNTINAALAEKLQDYSGKKRKNSSAKVEDTDDEMTYNDDQIQETSTPNTPQTSGEGTSGTKRPRRNCDEEESETHMNLRSSNAATRENVEISREELLVANGRLTQEKQDLAKQIDELRAQVEQLEKDTCRCKQYRASLKREVNNGLDALWNKVQSLGRDIGTSPPGPTSH
ncbi:glutamic acid-rich protein-like isoform X2 [Gadus morhua]|uniref:glutamic acid-rich protein-like isoform X2 n=1 Tax=Gadus morhua TaxID=8049 RepID=UPI0011B71457|nr:glutamic acid-rich protein-like isoform X2 [Gadus morhua]